MLTKQVQQPHGQATRDGAFCRGFGMMALAGGLLLATATLALAAPDLDNNPPGPRGGPGTNWENPPGPRGGPGASPDAKPWRPWILRRLFGSQDSTRPHRPLRPWTQRRIYNAQQPAPDLRPWTQRRIYNATPPTRFRRRR